MCKMCAHNVPLNFVITVFLRNKKKQKTLYNKYNKREWVSNVDETEKGSKINEFSVDYLKSNYPYYESKV